MRCWDTGGKTGAFLLIPAVLWPPIKEGKVGRKEAGTKVGGEERGKGGWKTGGGVDLTIRANTGFYPLFLQPLFSLSLLGLC